MTNKYSKAALTVGLLCLPLLPMTVKAQVTPEQYKLMTTAASKDGGKDFDILIDLLIAANPENEEEIRQAAAEIRPAPPAPAPVQSSPSIAEGTIFSDSFAEKLSNMFLPGWEKEIEINALYTTGNTVQKSFGTGTKFFREAGPHQQTVTTYFDLNSSDGITNKRRYGLSFKNDYSINDISYASGFAGFEGDSFGPFNKRLTLNAGYGIRIFDNDSYKWSVEAGPALLMTKPLPTEDYESDITGYTSSLFSWIINDRSDLENETKIYVGNKMVVENKTDYKIQISGALSGKLSFDILYNRNAPIDRKKTDTVTRVGVLYDF